MFPDDQNFCKNTAEVLSTGNKPMKTVGRPVLIPPVLVSWFSVIWPIRAWEIFICKLSGLSIDLYILYLLTCLRWFPLSEESARYKGLQLTNNVSRFRSLGNKILEKKRFALFYLVWVCLLQQLKVGFRPLSPNSARTKYSLIIHTISNLWYWPLFMTIIFSPFSPWECFLSHC